LNIVEVVLFAGILSMFCVHAGAKKGKIFNIQQL